MTDWKDVARTSAIGAGVAFLMGFFGFLFLASRNYQAMGSALFILIPFAAGFSIAMVARKLRSTVSAILLSVSGVLLLLVFLGKEGWLCVLFALPIIVGGMAIGVGFGVLLRKVVERQSPGPTTGMLMVIVPMLIFAGERIERPILRDVRTEVVQNSVVVNASPDRVWDSMLSFDSLQVSKPALMYVGLPIPERCTLQGRGVGATRTCYFDVGYIQETIVAWDPPHRMTLAIDRTHMPGRHWLSFENAEYTLQPNGSATLLTRTTTVASRLHPAWYWRPLERLGVEEEHEYILREVVRKNAQ